MLHWRGSGRRLEEDLATVASSDFATAGRGSHDTLTADKLSSAEDEEDVAALELQMRGVQVMFKYR